MTKRKIGTPLEKIEDVLKALGEERTKRRAAEDELRKHREFGDRRHVIHADATSALKGVIDLRFGQKDGSSVYCFPSMYGISIGEPDENRLFRDIKACLERIVSNSKPST